MSAVLISDDYRAQQEALHENPNYGVASVQYAPIVSEVCNTLGVRHVLDYGAGKCRLFQNLKVKHPMKLQAYDPGVPKLSAPPIPAELVTCIDVLEHIEPELLDNVLDDLERLTEVVGVFTVHTGPAAKTLADGRNAHLIQEPPEWWLPRFMCRFDLHAFQVTGENQFYVICYAKPKFIEGADGDKL
jgi:hypothetical protein